MNSILNLNNEKGSLSIIILFGFLVIFLIMAIATDIPYLYGVKVHGRHSLNLALRAASAQLDMDALEDSNNPQTIIEPDQAAILFERILQENMKLDENFNPLSGSAADGQVEVLYFKVVNAPEIPFTYTYNGYTETINKVSTTAIIKVPVKLTGWARVVSDSPDKIDMLVHSTVGPEQIPQK